MDLSFNNSEWGTKGYNTKSSLDAKSYWMSNLRSLAHIVGDKSKAQSLKRKFGINSLEEQRALEENNKEKENKAEKVKENNDNPPPFLIDLKESNVVGEGADNEKVQTTYFNSPSLELMRKQAMDKLRNEFENFCNTLLFLDQSPKDSFSRWLLERMILGGTSNSEFLIPSLVEPEISPSMKRELLENIPYRPIKVKNTRDAVHNLRQYMEKVSLWLNDKEENKDILKTVHCLSFLYLDSKDIYQFTQDQVNEAFDKVKSHSQADIQSIATPIVEYICKTMSKYAHEESQKLKKTLTEISQPHSVPSSSSSSKPHTSKSPIQNFKIRVNNFSSHVEIICQTDTKTDSQKINSTHFEKLKLLYEKHSRNDKLDESKQLETIYCLLRRYQTFFGNIRFEGTSLQGALTPRAFSVLHDLFGVTFECFASPLNCYFPDFCSAFPDTDVAFGSRGSFLSFHPISGSFEANPPFTEELMDKMVDHMENVLAGTSQPLSFVIFVPEWIDPPANVLIRLRNSVFLRGDFVVNKGEHAYIGGEQHLSSQSEAKYTSIHGTHVFFIQNDAGFEKWAPTKEKMDHLKREMF